MFINKGTIGVVDTETTDVVEKINIISNESSTPVMDGSYKLLWCHLKRKHKIIYQKNALINQFWKKAPQVEEKSNKFE